MLPHMRHESRVTSHTPCVKSKISRSVRILRNRAAVRAPIDRRGDKALSQGP